MLAESILQRVSYSPSHINTLLFWYTYICRCFSHKHSCPADSLRSLVPVENTEDERCFTLCCCQKSFRLHRLQAFYILQFYFPSNMELTFWYVINTLKNSSRQRRKSKGHSNVKFLPANKADATPVSQISLSCLKNSIHVLFYLYPDLFRIYSRTLCQLEQTYNSEGYQHASNC